MITAPTIPLLRVLPLIFTLAAMSSAYSASKPGSPDVFEARVYTGAGGKTLPYRLLKPAKYDREQKYPVVLFLHGAGERGTDNVSQLKHCVGLFTEGENRAKFPCFVIVPQCPPQAEGQPWGWTGVHPRERLEKTGGAPGSAGQLSLEIIEALEKEFSIDAQRLYITGLSMGGFATWDIIGRHPDRFAAAIPVCGGGNPDAVAPAAKVPVWAFHGGADPVVPATFSQTMVEAMRKAGGTPKYTEYPKVGHDSWDPAFNEPELLPWLFAQKR